MLKLIKNKFIRPYNVSDKVPYRTSRSVIDQVRIIKEAVDIRVTLNIKDVNIRCEDIYGIEYFEKIYRKIVACK